MNKKISIAILLFLILSISVYAEFHTMPASRQTHSSDIEFGCQDGQYYRPGPKDCIDICPFNYEFKNGICVSRCEGDKGMVWFDDRQLCEDICITQPQHDMCEDGKWVGFDNCPWYQKLIGLCGEKSEDKDQDNSKPTEDSEKTMSKEDCEIYGKWVMGKCKIRTECTDQELWDGQKCEFRCEFDEIWFNSQCVNENDPYGLYDMSPDSHKVVEDEKGKYIGIIRHANGAIVYTRDGQRYYQSIDEMDNKGVMSNLFEGVVNGWDFVVGKIFVAGKNEDEDKKMQEQVADELLKELKGMDVNKEWRNKVAEKAVTEGVSEGMGILIGPAAKGISAPGETIKMLSERGSQVEFETDVKNYIEQREFMGQADIMSNGMYNQDYSTEKLFKNNKKEMFDTLEVAYQRYLLYKSMKGK